MGHIKILFGFLCFVFFRCVAQQETVPAVTVVPVADLVLEQLTNVYPKKNVAKSYRSLSLEGAKKSVWSCPRVHQLLFNEQVEIIRYEDDEVLIKIPQCFYLAGNIKQNKYWSHKNNILPLSKKLRPGLFPEPIRFSGKNKDSQKKQVITLLFPFQDKKNGRTFSAGTKFVRAKTKQEQPHLVAVWAFSPRMRTHEMVHIPKKLCLARPPQTSSEKRKLFVQLLQRWSARPNGSIPYVWGGCSFTRPYTQEMIKSVKTKLPNGRKVDIFRHNKPYPIAGGLDCSGAILRAAQIANIPYFFKNSSTALKNLEQIKQYEQIKAGDLLYTSGHIMMVADLKEGKLVESRSHWYGFGSLHEEKLNHLFKDMNSYKKLFAQSEAKKPLVRIDEAGKVIGKPKVHLFLKLPV